MPPSRKKIAARKTAGRGSDSRKTASQTDARRKKADSSLSLRDRLSLRERLLGVIQRGGLLRPGDRIGVAVSGGADSVALLLLMIELQSRTGVSLSVLHFNHQLRGRASDADEKFVSRLAGKFGLPFHRGGENVKALARGEKSNLEDAARRARYAFFDRAAQQFRLNKIAVAHTADDQGETVLAHILRGTGLAGLGGIHPQMRNVVRPLLGIRREELRVFLRQEKQSWREDATNRDLTKLRARIRNKLIPYLEKNFQPQAVEHLRVLSSHAREDNALLNRVVEERLNASLQKTTAGMQIRISDLLQINSVNSIAGNSAQESDAASALSQRLLRNIIGSSKPRAGQISTIHIAKVLELARNGKSGSKISLPGGLEVRRLRDALVFRDGSMTNATCEYEYLIDHIQRGEMRRLPVPELRCEFRVTVIDWPGNRVETSVSGDILDAGQLRFPLLLRNWRPGDRFRATGHASTQKLKRLMNQKGLDRWERIGWPVIVSNGILAWARGFGASADFVPSGITRAGVAIVEETSS